MATRFRAYQLGNEGSSFSYGQDGDLTLIEARVTQLSWPNLLAEARDRGGGSLGTLHITSWDLDHCEPEELAFILKHLTPTTIEYPGYAPHTDRAREALRKIEWHQTQQKIRWTPAAIGGLTNANGWERSNIIYWPREITDNSNDNSTVKLFRSGEFTVLSLGDVESPAIAKQLLSCPTIRSEVDVMILAHHGADNGFTTIDLLEAIRPRVAICSSNYDNQYEHPCQEIRDLLWECDVPVFTTKTGDVIIDSLPGGTFRVTNLIANSTEVSSTRDFSAKRTGLMRAFVTR